jgi:uncharacterized protein (TIGR03643 family)
MVEKLSLEETNCIIGMAWEDRTPFDAIGAQFGLSEQVVIGSIRRELRSYGFRL